MPEATYTYIYCTSVKDYLLNLLENVEVADLIAPHVRQLTTLPSEPACRLIKPIEIDYKWNTSTCLILQGNIYQRKWITKGITTSIYSL